MRWTVLFAEGLLAGCDMPGADYRGVETTRVSVAGSVFDVRVKGLRAEAVRVNTRWAPNRESVAVSAVAAIEGVSGCEVAGLDGDQAMITARLDCGSGAPPPRRVAPYYECEIDYVIDGFGEMICYPS